MRLYLSHLAGAALVDVTLKALLAVVIAGFVAALLRKTAASTRHAIWLTSTVILLTLPIAAVALPQLSLPLLPAEPIATETEAKPLDIQLRQLSPQAASNAPLQHTIVAGASGLFATVRSWSMAGMVVWGAGALLMMVRAAVGFVQLHYLRQSGEEVNDPVWRQALEQAKQQIGVQRDVRLHKSSRAKIPVSWGLWRVYICLPTHADEWSATNRRMVLTHELMHVRRGDYLWQLLAIAMTATHWFNPMAWWAAHRLRMEAEIACDDAVIACGCRPSDYAACLYQMVLAAKSTPLCPDPTLSMARPSELPRRLAMILSDKTKHHGTHLRTLLLTLIASAVLGLAFGAVQVSRAQAASDKEAAVAKSKEQGDKLLDHINASPMEEAGVYHISPVFKKLAKVTVIKRGGPYRPDHKRLLEGWDFDKKTGRLTVKETMDNEKEMVVVYGKRKVRWAWQMQGPISDVKVLIGKEAAVHGEDYEVDEDAGTVQFLKKEHCKKGVHHYINYGYRDEPSKSGSIGNHPDQALVRKFLGLHPTPDKKEDIGKTVGTNASRTDNPKVWTMTQSMRSDSIRVGLGRRSVKDKLDWLERGKDFAYDETLATITLLREIPLAEDSWMFVSGVPPERGQFLLRRELAEGEVKVILGDRLLQEGVGYKVDREQGIVTIVDKAIEKKGAEYYISAGGRSMGNHSDKSLILKLLRSLSTQRLSPRR
jgi:beta-lactamase regulating signal transducer with metallopeptidase domain